MDQGNTKIDLTRFAADYAEAYLNDVGRLSRVWMKEFMSTDRPDFDNLDIHFNLTESMQSLHDAILDYPMSGKLSAGKNRDNPLVRSEKETFEATGPRVESRVSDEDDLGGKDRPGRLIEPVARFLHMVAYTYQVSRSRREDEAQKRPRIRAYIELADLLEKAVLNRNVQFSLSEPGPGRKLLYQRIGERSGRYPIGSASTPKTSFGESGNHVSLERRSGEVMLLFEVDEQCSRQLTRKAYICLHGSVP